MPKIDPSELGCMADAVEATLLDIGQPPSWTPGDPASHAAWRGWWDATDARLVDRVVDLGGYLLNTRLNSSRMVLGGVISTCTSGHRGAVQNWLAAARRKLAALQASAA